MTKAECLACGAKLGIRVAGALEPEPCARCGRALRDRCWSHDGNLYCTESCMLADIEEGTTDE